MNASFLKMYKSLCIGIFFLIALGGAVRAMNAGLACPDWPLCFGDVIPDYHPQVYFEFMHRVLAGLIGIVSVWLNIKVMRSNGVTRLTRGLAGLAILLLLTQVVMGGLTVLLKLHDKIVATHLALGTGFLALSLWIYLSVKFKTTFPGSASTTSAKKIAWIVLGSVYAQILLGALVASNYAANVCTEFPLCHGEFIPTLKGTIGLHVIHRLGAYTLTIIIISCFVYVRKYIACPEIRRWMNHALIALTLQVALGISNVVLHTPPLITVLHLAMGAYLLSVGVRLVRLTTFRA